MPPVSDRRRRKPRLFYYEEAFGLWCPWADGYPFDALLAHLDENETTQLQFKRLDMSDDEMDSLPEAP